MGIKLEGYALAWHAVTPAAHTIVKGAAGWIDEDVSTEIPVNAKIAQFGLLATGIDSMGVRCPGETSEPRQIYGASTWIYNVCGVRAGHVEAYRNAIDDVQIFPMGWM